MRDSVVDLWRECPMSFSHSRNHKLQALGMSMDRDKMAARQSVRSHPRRDRRNTDAKNESRGRTRNAGRVVDRSESASLPAMWLARAVGFSCPGSELRGAEGRHFRHGRDVDLLTRTLLPSTGVGSICSRVQGETSDLKTSLLALEPKFRSSAN